MVSSEDTNHYEQILTDKNKEACTTKSDRYILEFSIPVLSSVSPV